MKNLITIALLIISVKGLGQQPPDTDIILFDLTVKKKKITLSNPENITSRKGYDNQPFFHPDEPLIYYAAADESGRTDIKVYNYQTRTTEPFTTTPEREYSPTVTPDKKYISCIIQRDNGAQDLGKYPIGGGPPEVIIDNLIVGYHSWLDHENVLVFVLGQPNSLRWYAVADKKDRVIAERIGRSLHRIPGMNAISFVDKQSSEWTIGKLNASDQSIETVATTLPEREDLAWTPDQIMLMSDGSQIFFRPIKKGKSWTPVEIASDISLNGVTRLAVNATGNKIAVVVSE